MASGGHENQHLNPGDSLTAFTRRRWRFDLRTRDGLPNRTHEFMRQMSTEVCALGEASFRPESTTVNLKLRKEEEKIQKKLFIVLPGQGRF